LLIAYLLLLEEYPIGVTVLLGLSPFEKLIVIQTVALVLCIISASHPIAKKKVTNGIASAIGVGILK
jgi:hypothetical protein